MTETIPTPETQPAATPPSLEEIKQAIDVLNRATKAEAIKTLPLGRGFLLAFDGILADGEGFNTSLCCRGDLLAQTMQPLMDKLPAAAFIGAVIRSAVLGLFMLQAAIDHIELEFPAPETELPREETAAAASA